MKPKKAETERIWSMSPWKMTGALFGVIFCMTLLFGTMERIEITVISVLLSLAVALCGTLIILVAVGLSTEDQQ